MRTPRANPQSAAPLPVSAVTEITVRIASDREIIEARQHGRAMAVRLGFGTADRAMIAAAISELARNLLLFAERGHITVAVVEQASRHGLRIVASDSGPGIADIDVALEDGWSSAGRLGFGLAGVKRLMNEFSVTSTPGGGTTVTAIKWRTS